MSVWVTEEVMRWGVRFCSRRFLWQQRSLLVKDKPQPGQQVAQFWGSRQSQACFYRTCVSLVRSYSDREKEHLSSPPADSSLTSDLRQRRSPFMDHLQRCASPSDVLDLTCQSSPTLRHISRCLTHMWASTKKMSDEQLRSERQLMFEHPGFDKLLQKAMRTVGDMYPEEMAYCLLAMVKLGVPQGSRVVQTFLRACQENLNDFDEKGLSILASSLENMEAGPNVSALKDGMRLAVEARLPGIKDVVALQSVMRLLGKDASPDLKRKLEGKALSMAAQFSNPNSQYMLHIMASTGFYSKPLLHVCSQKIKENLHGVPFNRLLSVLQSCRELHYRDMDLLTAMSDYVTSTKDVWTKKQMILFLSACDSLAFCPASSLDAFAETVIAAPDALTLKDLLCVLRVYSSLNYDLQRQRQRFLDSLSQSLDSYLSKMSWFELLKAVYCLCLLGHFPSAALERLLQSATLDNFNTTPRFAQKMFHTVKLCLRLERPPLCPQSLTSPDCVPGDGVPTSRALNPLLSQGLRRVVEERADSSTLLQEMVVVEDVYLIDGVITKVSSSPAESSRRVAVICPPRSAFCFGTSNPRGPLAVKIRHLRILGYEPVVVTEQELQCEEDRTEFLRRRMGVAL